MEVSSQWRQPPTRPAVDQDRQPNIIHPVTAPLPVGGASLLSFDTGTPMSESDHRELFEALKAVRTQYPDWRFGQLVCNVATWARGAKTSSVWEVEDQELIKAAREHLHKREAQDG